MRLFIIYAGPKNSVCGMTQAKWRGILNCKSYQQMMKMYQVNAVKMINTDSLNDELAFETTSIIQQYLNKS